MEMGRMVRLQAYGDKEVILRLVRQNKNTLIVCNPEEYELAQLQKREPKCVGFNKRYLVAGRPG